MTNNTSTKPAPLALDALALAVLAYYADPRFDDKHSAPAHPGLGAYITTPEGIEAARHAGYTALIVGDFDTKYCGSVMTTKASLAAPIILGDAECTTATGAARLADVLHPAATT